MRITIPEQFAKCLTSPDYVNDCLNYYWKNKSGILIPAIESRLLALKTEWKNASKYPETFEAFYGNGNIINRTSKYRSFLRLAGGYNILFGTFISDNTRFELYSEDAYELKLTRKIGKKLTSDHIFGTTEIGVKMFKNYVDSNWDVKYMSNEYVPQTLHLNCICRILKSEHQKENVDDTSGVARGKHTLIEKVRLLHYIECGIPLPLQVHKLGII